VIGWFGWKAVRPALVSFIGLAMVNEPGSTTHFVPNEMPLQRSPIGPAGEIVAGLSDRDISRIGPLAFVVSSLALSPRGPITDALLRGEQVVTQLGCGLCHTPSARTGPPALEALNHRGVPLFSDVADP
jgi:CxxC motif-containing protein (DUF1111 family)